MTFETQGYYVRGGRTGVLLMHGLCGTPTEMRFVANGLARTGCTVYCPMLAGHGGTEEDIKRTTWQDWYASAERALDRLREDCDTVIVGGLSTGAVLALLLAARRPADVQGTALLAPTLWLNGWLIPWYARLFRLVFSKRIANLIGFPDLHPHGIKDERIRNFALDAMRGADNMPADITVRGGGTVYEFFSLVRNVRPMLSLVKLHTLIFHPRHDDQSDIKNTMTLQRKLGGVVEVSVLEDSYHLVTLDRQRNYVVDRTAEFVDRILAAEAVKSGRKQASSSSKQLGAAE